MAIGATLTVVLSGGSTVLNRINQDNYASEFFYKDSTRSVTLRIRHTTTTPKGDVPAYDRHNVEIVETFFKTPTDPEFSRKCYFVIEQLPSDDSVANFDGLCDLSIATSNAFLKDLMAWIS